jgi:hypothetical protein
MACADAVLPTAAGLVRSSVALWSEGSQKMNGTSILVECLYAGYWSGNRSVR